MLVYPQLSSGALGQFPIEKRQRLRTIVNRMPDGSVIKLPDPAGAATEWSLRYSGLTSDELATIEQFVEEAEGTRNEFTFLDPVSNLLARSDQLDHTAWVRGPLLALTEGVADPLGGRQGWRLDNTGAGTQTITQTIPAPAMYLYSLSVYVRADTPTTVALVLGSQRFERPVTREWTRLAAASSGEATFGVEVAAGATLEVFGIQAEPQATPSPYQSSTVGGVYEGARLAEDELLVTTTGVNQSSCTVKIIHAKHI